MFTREDNSSIPDTGDSDIPSMPDIKVDWKGVHKLLKNLKTYKATGPDEIPAYILKTATDELASTLSLLFQLSIDLGEIPEDWRQAFVVPILKKETNTSHRITDQCLSPPSCASCSSIFPTVILCGT